MSDEATLKIKIEGSDESPQLREPPPAPHLPEPPSAADLLKVFEEVFKKAGAELAEPVPKNTKTDKDTAVDSLNGKQDAPWQSNSRGEVGVGYDPWFESLDKWLEKIYEQLKQEPATPTLAEPPKQDAAKATEAGTAAEAGPAGIAVMAALKLKEELNAYTQQINARIKAASDGVHNFAVGTIQEMGQFRVQVLSTDFRGFSRGVADLTAKLPLVGREAQALAHSLLDLEHSVEMLGHRYAQFNGDVAAQQVQGDMRRFYRDQDRANNFSPQIVAAMQSQQNFEEKISRQLDRFFPVVATAASQGLDVLSAGVDKAEPFIKDTLRFFGAAAALISAWSGEGQSGTFIRLAQAIAAGLKDQPQSNGDNLFNDLMRGLSDFAANMPGATEQAARGDVQPNFPGI